MSSREGHHNEYVHNVQPLCSVPFHSVSHPCNFYTLKIGSYIKCADNVHVGNPVPVLPGNQEVISRQSRSSHSPPSKGERESWILHFRDFPLCHLYNILSER